MNENNKYSFIVTPFHERCINNQSTHTINLCMIYSSNIKLNDLTTKFSEFYKYNNEKCIDECYYTRCVKCDNDKICTPRSQIAKININSFISLNICNVHLPGISDPKHDMCEHHHLIRI